MSNKSLFENGNADSSFDRHFTKVEKTISRTWTAIMVVWVASAIASLAVVAGIAYVVWHFIQKVW